MRKVFIISALIVIISVVVLFLIIDGVFEKKSEQDYVVASATKGENLSSDVINEQRYVLLGESIGENDPSYCIKNFQDIDKEECLFFFYFVSSVRQDDETRCLELQKEDQKQICLALVRNDLSLCVGEEMGICKKMINSKLAENIRDNDSSICESGLFDEKKICYALFGS
jgi:hypothetical protein